MDRRPLVRYRDERRSALGLDDQAAEELVKGCSTHKPFHIGDGDQALFEHIVITGRSRRFDYGRFIGVFSVRSALDEFETAPLFSVVDRGIQRVGADFIRPFGQIIEMG